MQIFFASLKNYLPLARFLNLSLPQTKNFLIYFMKHTIKFFSALSLVALLFMSGCDDCKDVDCGTAAQGTCVEGVCECLAGYEGEDCKTNVTAKFIGTYVENGNCSETGAEAFTVTIAASSSDMTKILITGFWGFTTPVTATVNADGLGFTIPTTSITGTIYGTVTVSGTGTRTSSSSLITATFTVVYTDAGTTYTDVCSAIVWTKQ